MDTTDVREIVYRFGDAPVPPEHHRSYEIRVTRGAVEVRVDSYGDVLAESTAELASGEFHGVVDALRRHDLQPADLGEDEGCVGGTSESVVVLGRSGELFSGTVHRCGGRNTGNLGGDVGAFREVVRALVPGLARLLA